MVRDQRDGHGPVQVRRAREGLALGRQEEPGLLGQGQAVSGRLPRAVHLVLVGAGRGHPRRARPCAVPRLQPGRTATPSSRPSARRSRCRRARGTASSLVAINHERKPFDDRRVRRALTPGPRPLRGVAEPVADHRGQGGRRHPGAGDAVGHAARRSSRSSPATAATSPPAARRRGGSCARPACRTASRSPSRTAASPSPTSPWASGSSTSGARSGSTSSRRWWRPPSMVSVLRRGDFEVAMRRPVQLRGRARHRRAEVPVDRGLRQQLRPLQGPRPRRSLHQAGARRSTPRSASGISAPSRSGCSTRRPTTSTRSSGTASCPQRQGAGLDHHAQPLPEPAARRGLARRVSARATINTHLVVGAPSSQLAQRTESTPRRLPSGAPPRSWTLLIAQLVVSLTPFLA